LVIWFKSSCYFIGSALFYECFGATKGSVKIIRDFFHYFIYRNFLCIKPLGKIINLAGS